jgi:general secretion pathway protein C
MNPASSTSTQWQVSVHDWPAFLRHWPASLRRRDTQLTSLLLSVLIAVELGRIAMGLLGGDPGPARRSPAQTTQPRSSAAGVDVTKIVSAHLFGLADSERNSEDPALAPRSAANLTLVGTIATQNPQRGMALVGDPDQARVYSVGQEIGGASLRWVYLDHVVLDRNGSLETLALPRAPSVRLSLGKSAAVVPQGSAAAAARENEPPKTVVEQAVETDAHSTADGHYLGIRIFVGGDVAAFNHSGLHEGDIVVAINGTKLTDSGRGQELWRSASTGTTVTVMRSDKPKDVVLNFAP